MMRLEYVFQLRMSLGERIHIPLAAGQVRGAVLVAEGSFEGPGLRGTVVSGSGGDFPLVRHDRGGRFDSQYLLRTHDGACILKRSTGVRCGDDAVIDRLMAGEDVDPNSYYMRMTPRFEAPAGPYDWLNRTLFVGVGRRYPTGSLFRYWKVV
jgi:hypothetical protein